MFLKFSVLFMATSAVALPAMASEPAATGADKPPVLTAPYDPLSPEVQKEALAWVTRNARPLDVPAQDLCSDPLLDPETLKPIAEALAKPRVIGIGEVTHGDCESFAYKASLIRALVLYNGVTVIGMEASIEGGRQLDAFIAAGQPVLAGDALVAAADKALLAANIFGLWKTHALRDLLAWLRTHNQTAEKPVVFANFDTQSPIGDSRFAMNFLSRTLANPSFGAPKYAGLRKQVADIATTLTPLLSLPTTTDRFDGYLGKQTGSAFEAHRAAAQQLLQLFAEAPAPIKKLPDFGMAEQSAFGLANWMEASVALARRSRDELIADLGTEVPPVAELSVRDRGMADSVLRILRRYPAAKMALWAHNRHVGKSGFRSIGADALSMGQNLGASLASDYAALTFTAYGGDYNPIVTLDDKGKPTPAETFPLLPNPYTLGAFFKKLDQPRFWLDMHRLPYPSHWALAWRHHPYIMNEGGYAASKADLYPTAILPVGFDSDIVVFFATIHPAVSLAPRKKVP